MRMPTTRGLLIFALKTFATHPVALCNDLNGRGRVQILRDVIERLLDENPFDFRIDPPRNESMLLDA